jgi:hypothetical protein
LEIKMNDFDSFIDSLQGEPIVTRASSTPRQTWPCGQCGGTGKWSGGVNRHGNSNCLACKGVGHFLTSPEHRAGLKQRIVNKQNEKADALRRSIKLFAEEHPDMWKDLCAARNDFTASLHASLTRWGTLTQNQIAAWYRGQEKLQAIRAERNAVANAKSGDADLSRIREMFDAATASGFKKPVYRAEGLKITLAPATGRNSGALYVVQIEDDAYQGKVEGVTFKAMREANADTLGRLQTIARNPMEAAVRYGRQTGRCSCCGRELTNKASIDAGIGPICAGKWGL